MWRVHPSFHTFLAQAAPDTSATADPSAAEQVTENPWSVVVTSLKESAAAFLDHLPNIVVAIVLVFATWGMVMLTGYIVRKVTAKSNMRSSLAELIGTLSRAAVWVFGLTIAAIVLFPGLNFAQALGAAGLASVAIGLAFKDIFENFFAGILLMWKFPFEPGDFIECGDVKGKVIETELRLTTIRCMTGELIIVPNAYLVQNPIDVLTSNDLRRVEITTGVGYAEDVATAVGVLEKALDQCSLVDTSKPRDVLAKGFGASSIDIDVLFWAKSAPLDMRKARAEVVIALKKALDDAGIEIPFPYRTLTFSEPLQIQQQSEQGN